MTKTFRRASRHWIWLELDSFFCLVFVFVLQMYCAIRGSQAWNSNDSRIATVDAKSGRPVGRPALVTRGFLNGDEDNKLVEAAIDIALRAIQSKGDRAAESGALKAQLSDSVSRFLNRETKRRPLVVPVVVEV